MLTKKEIERLKENAKIHKILKEKIEEILVDGTSAYDIDILCEKIAKKFGVLCGFKGVYSYPNNVCVSVNDIVVHGRPKKSIIFKDGDLVTIDFGIKDKQFGVNTDAAFSIIIGGSDKNPEGEKLIEANKKALHAGIKKARVGNTIGDISFAIQKEIELAGYKVVHELTGHSVGKKLHEKPYIPNYGSPGTGAKIKKGMVLAIEPILGQTCSEIIDKNDWEIYIKDGSLGCQYEHTVLVTDGEPEIIV